MVISYFSFLVIFSYTKYCTVCQRTLGYLYWAAVYFSESLLIACDVNRNFVDIYCTVVLKGQSLKIKRLWYFEILYKLSCFYFLQHPQARACFRQIIFFIPTTKNFEFRCSSTRFSKTSLFYLILERNTVCRFFEIYILPIFKDISQTAI